MLYTVLKFLISALLIVLISEAGTRSSVSGAILASLPLLPLLPLLSVLAIIWIYVDTKNVVEIAALSKNIFWLVLPSLVLFISLPIFLNSGWSFYLALLSSCALTIAAYFMTLCLLKNWGVM